MLDNIFNGKVNWFYDGEFKNGKATVPVKVTIASQKYKSKTFTINLNITKDYLISTKSDYKSKLKNNNNKFNTSILNIEKKKKEIIKFSHENISINKNNIMKSGTNVHEVLEYLDFKNPDLDKYELDNFLKFKIKKLLDKDFIKTGKKLLVKKEFLI